MIRSFVLSLLLLWMAAFEAQAQQWAAKMFKSTYHDFGTVARGSKAEFAFEFENIYQEDVHVASVRSSCGCTTPTFSKSTVKTWDKASVIATYNTRSFLGRKGATITVVFDRPYYAEVQLNVSGYIRSDVVLDPGEVNFGEVEQFGTAEKSIKVDYAGRTDWRIVDVRSANPDLFEVELNETRRAGGRVGYDMLIRLKPDSPPGYFHDQLTIVCDDARLQTIPLNVEGNVVSPLTVSPASLFLGVLEPKQSVTKQLVVRGKQPFNIVSISCDEANFEFKSPGEEKKLLHFIPVTFTAGDSAGKVTGTIEIETDLGEGATATCVATGTIRDPAGT